MAELRIVVELGKMMVIAVPAVADEALVSILVLDGWYWLVYYLQELK